MKVYYDYKLPPKEFAKLTSDPRIINSDETSKNPFSIAKCNEELLFYKFKC